MGGGSAFAQTTASGVVYSSESNEPLVGATVRVVGTKTGAITDTDGKYSVTLPAGATKLEISYISMVSKTIKAGHNVKTTLDPDESGLQDVVVVAYGTQKKTSLTGAIESVKSEDIDLRPTSSVASALEGKVSGVQVNSTYGAPGTDPSIRIRGIGTVNGSTSPLYILDGVPYGGNVSDLNPADIESISVLKDAASAALYGNRASNGVIMITTKKGKSGKLNVNLDIKQGTYSRGIPEYDRVNTKQWMEVEYQNLMNHRMYTNKEDAATAGAYAAAHVVSDMALLNIFNKADDALFDANGKMVSDASILSGYSDDLDWYDQAVRNGYRQEYNLSANGSNEKSDYRFSVGYLDENGYFVNTYISGRFREQTTSFPKSQVDLMDVSPRMVFSVATSMVPFLQNDDANRALMGSNMQRQAVPLMITDSPIVGTGMEAKVAFDSGVCVIAKRDGVVEYSASDKIVIKADDGTRDTYKVQKFEASNQGACYNQRPIVFRGDRVKKDEIIADGPSTYNGELALGKNPLIGFMTWEGYNYEDAVLLSERLVRDDVYTSIHISKYEAEERDTKLGCEEITRDVPNISAEALKDLDERGIIRVGAEVRTGDILVGKVTPKGETEMTAEERLLRAIFGDKVRDVRDTSLKVPHGEYGIVLDTKVFTKENGDELAPGVNKTVRVYIAQKRKISVGDKMAGRHGNKGVVSRILPVEDMPFLPNGRPLDIVLNPLGVPSRMNIGQVLELHLGLAANVLGIKVDTPIFNGATEQDITDTLELANDYANTSWEEFTSKWKDSLNEDVYKYLDEHKDHRAEWRGVPIDATGKVQLRDGRTGEEFNQPVSIGFMHYLKLHHLVDDKIHARSTGPYAMVTQQPLGGKAQFGGQRFGEMEVWALEAYGAAFTLQEILTFKSDDVTGRQKAYEAIIKGENMNEAGIPESFKVLLKELQSLALDVRLLLDDQTEVEIGESVDYETNNDYSSMMSGDNSFNFPTAKSLGDQGYTTQEVRDGEITNVEEENSSDAAEAPEEVNISEDDDDSEE